MCSVTSGRDAPGSKSTQVLPDRGDVLDRQAHGVSGTRAPNAVQGSHANSELAVAVEHAETEPYMYVLVLMNSCGLSDLKDFKILLRDITSTK